VITTVLLLPLAPVKGVGWVAGVIAEDADRQMAASASPSRALEEVAAAAANGEISPEQAEAREAEIIQRMLAAHDPAGEP
jgi:hypothetical protein